MRKEVDGGESVVRGLHTRPGSGYDHLIEHSPFGIAVIDFDGFYREVNPAYCHIYGYARAQMLGMSFTEIFPAAMRSAILVRHRDFLTGAGPLSGEWTVHRRDGTSLVVMSESVCVTLPDGSPARLVYVVDVTARNRSEIALRDSEATFRALFETLPIGVVYHGLDGRIRNANAAALRILDMSLEQLQGLHPVDPGWHTVREDGSPFPGDQHPASVALRTGRLVENVVLGLRRPAGNIWLRVSAVPVLRDGLLREVYASFEDITLNVELARELRAQATTDYLTGALNRRSFMERLAAEFERVQRHPNLCSSVLIVDIDHFKQVNDSRGHAGGDSVLRHVTLLLQRELRRTDLLGRHGGEEFAVLLPETDAGEALLLAQRLREAVAAEPADHEGSPVPITVSIGVSQLRVEDAGVDAVLQRADQALYGAKHGGRNRAELCPWSAARVRADQA